MTTPENNKHYPFVKFAGSLSLLFTITGVLLAVGGQLNLLGGERQPTETVRKFAKTELITPIVQDTERPKYSFYDELKKRKTELGVSNSPYKRANGKIGNGDHYVVQVGAFKRQRDASRLRKTIERLGYPSRVAPKNNRFLTQAGPFNGIRKARDAEKRLRQHRLDTLVKKL